MHYNIDDLYPPYIFNPPQEEIDRILPCLVWPERTLHVLGMPVLGKDTIYDLGDGRIVKTGPAVSANEAKAMIFVRAHTNIPVPKVYMVFEHNGATHIVMERIDGIALREAQRYNAEGRIAPESPLTSPDGLRRIMRQLQFIIDEIRDLGRRCSPKDPHFGSWPSGPYRNSYFFGDLPTAPFSTVFQFHDYWLKRMDMTYRDDATYEDLLRLRNDSIYSASTPVLSHGDLAPRNILVKDDRIVAVVDWETFGWYPEFWETMAARNELASKPLIEAQRSVFGEVSVESDVYFRVYRCIAAGS